MEMTFLPTEIETCAFCKHRQYDPFGPDCERHGINVQPDNSCENFDLTENGGDAIRSMAKDIIQAYIHIRATNDSIPDESIDWMKTEALKSLSKLRMV